MAFQRGHFADFFKANSMGSAILVQRRRWLAEDAPKYMQVLPGADRYLREAAEMGVAHQTLPADADTTTPGTELARYLGEHWEPDYLILQRADAVPRLVCGCVCFPSSWALEEKIGRPMDEIHGVVPRLNVELGRQIATFLDRLKPGVTWMRSNWGLSRSPELNQHPSRNTPRLDETITLDQVHFRLEEQSLTALPATNGILFGIRVRNVALSSYRNSSEGERLANALETMPEAIAEYKGLTRARKQIIQALRG
jgi:hypothetical protein